MPMHAQEFKQRIFMLSQTLWPKASDKERKKEKNNFMPGESQERKLGEVGK